MPNSVRTKKNHQYLWALSLFLLKVFIVFFTALEMNRVH